MIKIESFELLANHLKKSDDIHKDLYKTIKQSTFNNANENIVLLKGYAGYFEKKYFEYSKESEEIKKKYNLISEEFFIIFICMEFLYNKTKEMG